MSLKYALPLLAFASKAIAQSSCSPSSTATLQNQGDAGAISGCSTFSGSIALATNIAAAISLDGIEAITGDLVSVGSTGLSGLSGPDLKKIGGTFKLINATNLINLNFGSLTSVDTIDFEHLSSLTQWAFSDGISSLNSLTVIDTQLSTLEGINPKSINNITLVSSNQLNTVEMDALTTVGNSNTPGLIQMSANGQSLAVGFPALQSIQGAISILNAQSVDVSKLRNISGTAYFEQCYFNTFRAPNVTSAGGITFNGNTQLTNLSFPVLTQTTFLSINNNSQLSTIDGFPDLSTIAGALTARGPITSFTFPDITNVKGNLDIISSQEITDSCNKFPVSKVVQAASPTCKGNDAEASTAGPQNTLSGSGSGSKSSASPSKAGAVSDLYARSHAVTGVLGVFAALLGML